MKVRNRFHHYIFSLIYLPIQRALSTKVFVAWREASYSYLAVIWWKFYPKENDLPLSLLSPYPINMKKITLSLFLTFSVIATVRGQSSQDIGKVVTDFLHHLPPDELKQTSYAFDDTLRTKWTNLPVGIVPRPGVRYGNLSDSSKMRVHTILTTLFSSQGYLKATGIMHLDNVLNMVIEHNFKKGDIDEKMLNQLKDLKWSLENYFISV